METAIITDFLGRTSREIQSAQFSTSVVKYTQQVSEAWHAHEKIHISAILQGGNLESRRGRDIQACPGTILFYEQGEVHRNRFTLHPSLNLNVEIDSGFFDRDLDPSKFKIDAESHIALLRIYFEICLHDRYSVTAMKHILQSLFWGDDEGSASHWVSELKEILNDRWNETPSLAELSGALDIHPVTISKYFPKHCGLTLANYMRKLKVEKAVSFIFNSSHSFSDIAFLCGFSDQSHMTRLVKLYTGLTPQKIRHLS